MLTWEEYYAQCRDIYGSSDGSALYDLGIQVATRENNIFSFDEEYYNHITCIREKLKTLFSCRSNTFRSNFAIALQNIYLVEEELEIIVAKYLKPYLEEKVFKSHIHCDNIKIYKTPPSTNLPASSWLWHIDNNPREQIKVMIYLDDVGEDTGPFTYLKNKAGQAIKASSTNVDYRQWALNEGQTKEKSQRHVAEDIEWDGSRIPPHVIDHFIKKGSVVQNCCSTAGTALLFDNNIIHRGMIPTKKARLAATFQFKPVFFDMEKMVDKEYTGNGWDHQTFLKNPEIYICKGRKK